MRKVLPGPGGWITKPIANSLKSQLGAPFEFPDLEEIGVAAKMRLILTEKSLWEDNLQKNIHTLWTNCGNGHAQGNGFTGNHPWKRWYGEGILASIYSADDILRGKGISRAAILRKVDDTYPDKECAA